MTESLNPLDPNYRAFAKIFEAFKVWSLVVSLFVITVKVLFILEVSWSPVPRTCTGLAGMLRLGQLALILKKLV